jgi:hypothetical protein
MRCGFAIPPARTQPFGVGIVPSARAFVGTQELQLYWEAARTVSDEKCAEPHIGGRRGGFISGVRGTPTRSNRRSTVKTIILALAAVAALATSAQAGGYGYGYGNYGYSSYYQPYYYAPRYRSRYTYYNDYYAPSYTPSYGYGYRYGY